MSRLFVFVEQEGGGVPLETSLQAVALAAPLGEVCSVSVGRCEIGGVARHIEIEHPLLSDYAPEAIGEALAQLLRGESPDALVAAGTERGNEILAHVAALMDLPMAANVVEVRPAGETWELTRTRWGGSLLEEASLSAPIKLATVALHAVAASPIGDPIAAGDLQPRARGAPGADQGGGEGHGVGGDHTDHRTGGG